jgi:hypothetical protein
VRVRIERNARAHGTADCLDDSHATVCADCLTRLAVSDRALSGPSSHNSRAFSRGCKAKLTHSEEHGMFKFEIIDLRQHFSYKEVAQRLKLPWLEPLDVARPCPHPRVLREAFSRGWGGVRPCRRCDGTRIVPGCLDCSE